MFDLKAKLLAKGLVTEEQVSKIDSREMNGQGALGSDDFAKRDRERTLKRLLSQSKTEQYSTIRNWVERNRLDKPSPAALPCEKFFITNGDAQISWLSLTKDVMDLIKAGDAGVVTYMSNHGLAHAVVPRDIAEDIGQAFPAWLKALSVRA